MKKLLTILLCFTVIFGAAACGKRTDDYHFVNPPLADNDWRDLPVDEGMRIDGRFDEPVYKNLAPLKFSKGDYAMDMSAYLGDTGVYIRANVTDNSLYYNTARPVYQNSSLIFYLAPYNIGEAPVLNKNTIQARVGINGFTEQWMGKPSADGYAYTRIFIPMMARIVLKNDKKDIDYTKGGDINIDKDVTGYDVEMFVPYTGIGLDKKPENILIMPEMNKCLAFTGENQRTMLQPEGMVYNNPSSFGAFGSNGYKKEGVVDGVNMGNGGKNATFGWDIRKDSYNEDREIVQKGTFDQKIYFKDLNATKYAIEAEITVKKGLSNDTHPKFGLLAAENEFNTYAFFVDPLQAMNNKWVLAVGRNEANTDWLWPAGMKEFPKMEYTDGETVKLEVIRDGAKFFFTVNGELAGYSMSIRGLGEDQKSYAGFMTMNTEAAFTKYSATTDVKVVEAKINALTVTPKEKTVDANLNDWSSEEKVNKISVYGIDEFSKQGFDVYAKYVAGDGLYLAGEAWHKTNEIGKNIWHENVNFEFYVQKQNYQKWIIDGNSSYLMGAMNTKQENDLYKTVFEIFIPEKDIPELRTEKDFVKIGFAFKVPGEFIKILNRDGGAPTDWWWMDKHHPSNADEMFYVYDDGLHTAQKTK